MYKQKNDVRFDAFLFLRLVFFSVFKKDAKRRLETPPQKKENSKTLNTHIFDW